MRRTFTFAAGWAVLTVLAGAGVWWGLGPLLAPIMQSAPPSPQTPSQSRIVAATTQPAESTVPAAPATASASASVPAKPKPTVTPSPAPSPKPSMFEGWQYDGTAFTQTFRFEGGEATLRIEGGRVTLVSSRAANGYTITPHQPSPDRLVLDFYNGTHFYVLDTMWWEQKPYAKLTQVS